MISEYSVFSGWLRSRIGLFFLVTTNVLGIDSVLAQTVGGTVPPPYDYCVRITAAVQKHPARITLNWQPIPQCYGFIVSRAPGDANTWTQLASLTPASTSFVDTNVTVGVAYRYKVTGMIPTDTPRAGADISAKERGVPPPDQTRKDERVGFILSGIEIPLTDSRGTIVLLVDSTQAAPLANEIARFQEDLLGDGWQVIRHNE